MSTPDERVDVEEAELVQLPADGPASLAREVERLVRDNVTERPAVAASWAVPGHVLAQVLRPGDELVVRDMERFAEEPTTSRGAAVTYDAISFATVCRRLGHLERTTLWAQQRSTGAPVPSITAVFDDHQAHFAPGWRECRAQLQVRMDPDWQAWAKVDGQGMDQVGLAEFFKSQLHVISDPPAATLIGAVSTFSTKRNVQYSQAINLDSGETQFTWVDKADQDAGTVELPNELTLSIRPFYGAPESLLKVWLRYRLDGGRLTFQLVRIRPDLTEENAWLDVCVQVRDELGKDYPFPILQGSPPDPLR